MPLFAGMSKKELSSVSQIADELDLPSGKELIREGELGSQFFVILDGEAEVRRRGRKLNTLRNGDFFGEISLLANRSTTATVTATMPLRVLVITRASFHKLLRDAPGVQWSVLQALVTRIPGDAVLSSS